MSVQPLSRHKSILYSTTLSTLSFFRLTVIPPLTSQQRLGRLKHLIHHVQVTALLGQASDHLRRALPKRLVRMAHVLQQGGQNLEGVLAEVQADRLDQVSDGLDHELRTATQHADGGRENGRGEVVMGEPLEERAKGAAGEEGGLLSAAQDGLHVQVEEERLGRSGVGFWNL